MWRYLAGGVAAILMVAAGWMMFSGRARSDPVLPPAPQTVMAADGGDATENVPVPEASAKTREEKRFDRYDKDRDGKIVREEYVVSRRKAFAKLDANGDGRLSFEEWGAKTLAKFAGADGDKSGAMDRTEFATTAVKRSARPKCVCPVAADGDN